MNEKRGQSQVYTRHSHGRGRQKGRRTVRKRQSRFGSKSAGKVVGDTYFEKAVMSMHIDGQEFPSNSAGGEEWEGGELYVEGAENDNGDGVYDSDENGQVSGDDYEDDDQGVEDYTVSYNGRRDTLMNDSEEDVEDDGNGDEDDDGGDEGPYDGGDGDEDEDGDDDRDEGEVNNVDDDIEGNELDDGEGNGGEDEGASSSSEYSDN